LEATRTSDIEGRRGLRTPGCRVSSSWVGRGGSGGMPSRRKPMRARMLIVCVASFLLGYWTLSPTWGQQSWPFDIGDLPSLRGGAMQQASSAEAQANGADFIMIRPGETKTIAELRGPAIVKRIWLTVKCSDDMFLRKVLFRVYWDNETNPSIDCPLGDFFGVGFALYKEYTSLLMGMSSGGYYCYFPMPFAQSARFEIVNQCEAPLAKFYFQITYQQTDSLPADEGYFQAKWRREEKTKRGKPYLVLDAKGKGKFVGCVLSLQGEPGGEAKFLEGDDKFYIDGAKEPSLRGTGVEDYFNSGWYFKEGEFAGPFHGCTVLDRDNNRISAYRFQVPDAIPFEKSLRLTFGHGEDDDSDADYSSVAYWYQTEPHSDFAPMPPAAARTPSPVAAAAAQPPVGQPPAETKAKAPQAPPQGTPSGTAFWKGYYGAGELALPFVACAIALLGLGYVLRRITKTKA